MLKSVGWEPASALQVAAALPQQPQLMLSDSVIQVAAKGVSSVTT